MNRLSLQSFNPTTGRFASLQPFFSVVICTHNRCKYLPGLAASLQAQTYPQDSYEIIIVNNASTDETLQVVSQLSEVGKPEINYVYESRLGLSNARNAGAKAAQGKIVAYIDDDAVADPGWLSALNDAFQEDDQVICVGGRIELLWENPRPVWMPVELEGYLGSNSFLGNIKREFPPDKHPFGGNIAIRRSTLQVVGGFDPNFGRVGTYLGAHEETRITDQLRCLGKIIYTPEALVYHCVPDWRASRKYLLKRGYLEGVASSNLAQVRRPRSRAGLFRTAAADICFLGGDLLEIVRTFFLGKQNETFAGLTFAVTRIGQLRRTLQIALQL